MAGKPGRRASPRSRRNADRYAGGVAVGPNRPAAEFQASGGPGQRGRQDAALFRMRQIDRRPLQSLGQIENLARCGGWLDGKSPRMTTPAIVAQGVPERPRIADHSPAGGRDFIAQGPREGPRNGRVVVVGDVQVDPGNDAIEAFRVEPDVFMPGQ